jgi:hypothetical protein
VATSTTGLMAGAANRNATAAAGCTPRAPNRPAIGTEAHSQPGNTAPANAAVGTANPTDPGRARSSTAGDSQAEMAPLTNTPNAKNGSACTTTATNTVAQVRRTTGSNDPCNNPRHDSAITTSNTTSRPSTRRRRRDSTRTTVEDIADKSSPPRIYGPTGSGPDRAFSEQPPDQARAKVRRNSISPLSSVVTAAKLGLGMP